MVEMILHRERPAVQGNNASQVVVFFFFVVVVCGLKVDAFQFLNPDLLHLQLSISSSPKPTGGSLGGVRRAKMEDQFFLLLSLLTVRKRTHPPLLFPSIHPADAAAASAAVAAERRGGSNQSGESAVIGLCIDQ